MMADEEANRREIEHSIAIASSFPPDYFSRDFSRGADGKGRAKNNDKANNSKRSTLRGEPEKKSGHDSTVYHFPFYYNNQALSRYSFFVNGEKVVNGKKGEGMPFSYSFYSIPPSALMRGKASYRSQRRFQIRDTTKHAPFKNVEKLPVNLMGGILGYTMIPWDRMVIRSDISGELLREVELHESIHTPDEYETRVITRWMLEDSDDYREI